ncbi:MAG: DUF4185 domain-containing protein [Candidatus Hodarchaeota archaeon]
MKIFKLISLIMVLLSMYQHGFAEDPPYTPSPVIESISWDFDNLVRLASGSDLWPVTWATDDNIYTCWGDGTGFGTAGDGWCSPDRVAMGFARLEGSATNFTATNVNGGQKAENPTSFPCEGSGCKGDPCKGKLTGILSVGGVIYGWINLQDNPWPNQNIALIWSNDLAATWQQTSWVFPAGSGNFKPRAFLNFGKDYDGARDDYVYFYGWNQGESTKGYMGRVNRTELKYKSSYQYFAGLDGNGNPIWSSNISDRKPFFEDPNGCTGGSVIYNSGLNRYIMEGHRGEVNKLAIFDAPEPWGPWTTVAYYDNWGNFSGPDLLHSFLTKWISTDGKTMWCIFSSTGELDSFNLIKASLTIGDTSPPTPPRGVQILDGK